MSWIQKVVDAHDKVESPRNFWYWSAIATLSAIVKDNVWLDRGGLYKLYPNVYVMLHADSGLKKGPPVALAKQIVRKVNNTRIISGRSSIQGILKELGQSSTSEGNKGKILKKSVGFIVASEFSSSLVSDPAAMTILTDLYDRHYNEGEYKSLLKMESFELKDPTVTLLVATNEAHFEDFVAKKDIQGGFMGRTFVIAENKVQTLNSLAAPLLHAPSIDELIEYPKTLSNITGGFEPLGVRAEDDEHPIKRMDAEDEYVWYSGAGAIYDDWYNDFYNSVREQELKDDTGTVQRFGDSVLKVAMLLSLAETPNLKISEAHMTEAITSCEKLIGNIRQTTMGKRALDDSATKKALITKELLNRDGNRVTRAILYKKYHLHFSNTEEFDTMMHSLEDAGMLQITNQGNQVVYMMPEQVAADMKEFLSGKNKRKQ